MHAGSAHYDFPPNSPPLAFRRAPRSLIGYYVEYGRDCANRRTRSQKYIVTYAAAVIIALLLKKVVGSANFEEDLNKYCRDRDRLITSEEIDEYLLVDVEVNSRIILECRYCDDKSKQQQAKIWHWQDRDQLSEIREVELGMNNDASLNRIHVTGEFSLVIRDVNDEDVGIYRCYGEKGLEEENKFNYRVELVFEDESIVSPDKGNITDWEKYRESNLVPVTLRFKVSKMLELVALREEGIKLEVVTEWGPWGECENCVAGRGERTRRSFCRIKRHFDKTLIGESSGSEMVKFFKKSPMLPCRSRILDEQFPIVSNATRNLPEFILAEKCKSCKKEKKVKKNKFKYKKRYLLAQGAHIAIACPESTIKSDVVWRKDSLLLQKGKGRSFRKKDPEPRVLLDTYYTLYLKGKGKSTHYIPKLTYKYLETFFTNKLLFVDVSEDEQGNYTCFVDDVRMLQAKVIVVAKHGLITEAFVRHLGYLAFILLITSFCYCVGVVRACKHREEFKIQTYEQLKEDKA